MNPRRSLGEVVAVIFVAAFIVTFALSALDVRVGMFVRVVLISGLIALAFSLMDKNRGRGSGSEQKPQAYYSDRR